MMKNQRLISIIFIISIFFVCFSGTYSESEVLKNDKKQLLQKEIIKKLKTIEDPELKINIYDLGLIRKINISDNNHISIVVIFTKLFCPFGKTMVTSIKKEVNSIPQVKSCKVTVDINTRWKRSMLTEEGQKKMKNIYTW